MLRVGMTPTDFCGSGGSRCGSLPINTKRLAVDADQADERMVVPRPVLRGRFVQMVAFRPDAQKGLYVTSGTAGGRKSARAIAAAKKMTATATAIAATVPEAGA